MSDERQVDRTPDRWARLRFAIVGILLSAPPGRGDLREAIEQLAHKKWTHPTTGKSTIFAFSTIERWYYQAKNTPRDPFGKLKRQVRKDAGRHRSMGLELIQVLEAQYRDHPSWSYQLHADNLGSRTRTNTNLGRCPSYETIRRFMRGRALIKKKRLKARHTEGMARAVAKLEQREIRSYEAAYVMSLWHLDFHEGSRKVILEDGSWKKAYLLGILDDCSRVACHVQWYLDESAETLVHGYSQAVQKRGLPYSTMSDNGSAMRSGEFKRGLEILGIQHDPTLPYSPYQNAKQEVFWAQVEGRLMAMLEGVEELTLELLNNATQAWVEMEYNRSVHSEIGMTPLERFLEHRSVGRPSPSSGDLRRAFRVEETRCQRRSDGTLSLKAKRFEIPSRFRHLKQVTVCYASWDLRSVDLLDSMTGQIVCPIYPQDKTANAEGIRRQLQDPGFHPEGALAQRNPKSSGIAPLLDEQMREYSAGGVLPAYLSKTARNDDKDETGIDQINEIDEEVS